MPDSTEPRHILTRFDQALNELRASLLRMASLAEQNFNMASRALAARDENLCNRVIAEDEEVDGDPAQLAGGATRDLEHA